jgi:uncharacterized membrane protein (DUF106 family)
MFNNLLDPILGPLLKLDLFLAILIISFLISLVISFIYKWTTDQTQMKSLKDEIKKNQEEMKKHKKDPEKMLKIQKKMMDANWKYMGMSIKPTLYTFLPIILIFGWLNAHFAYLPLEPNEPFVVSVTMARGFVGDVSLEFQDNSNLDLLTSKNVTPLDNIASWELKGLEGIYTLVFQINGKDVQYKDIIITSEKGKYAPVEQRFKDGAIEIITVHNTKVQPMKNIPLLGQIPWIGGFGWLGTYILFSILFSIGIRKILKLA